METGIVGILSGRKDKDDKKIERHEEFILG